MSVIELTNTYTMVVCADDRCDMTIVLDRGFVRKRKDDHRTFYCPNGHSNYWPQESDEEKLQKKVKNLEDRTRWQADQMQAARNDAAHERRRRAAAQGQLTKIKNRITNGVCPVPGCKRSGLGKDVVAHIATVHPDYHKHEE